jgi:hypothetical protein
VPVIEQMTQEEMKTHESPVEQQEQEKQEVLEEKVKEEEVVTLESVAIQAEVAAVEVKEAVDATIVAVDTVEKEVAAKGACGVIAALPAIRRAFCEILQAARALFSLLKKTVASCKSKNQAKEVVSEEPALSV